MSTFYTEDHEWVRDEGEGVWRVGITDYAQAQLGEVVYVELPEVGAEVERGKEAAVVESVKAAGEVKAPVGGVVVEGNEGLVEGPELVNEAPEGDGWLFMVRVGEEVGEGLMDGEGYKRYLSELG